MKIRIKTRILSVALCTGLMLTACQSGTGKTESAQPAAVTTEERNMPMEETALPTEETALPSEETSANQSGSKQPESAGDLWDLPKEASGQSGEAPGADDSGALSSHEMQEIKIGLPMNETGTVIRCTARRRAASARSCSMMSFQDQMSLSGHAGQRMEIHRSFIICLMSKRSRLGWLRQKMGQGLRSPWRLP